jgi:hypothetical protein
MDWDLFSTKFYALVSVTRGSSGTITCTISAYDNTGAYLFATANDSMSTTGSEDLTMNFTIPANTRTFVLYCDLPETSAVNLYEYWTAT